MSTTVPLLDTLSLTVGEVMIRAPKTLSADASMGEVRTLFERPSVRTVLLTEGHAFAGAIERDGVPNDAPDTAAARAYLQPEPVTATPGMAMSDAIELLKARGEPRLVVIADDGVTLAGLLCANASGTGFCVRP
jgi:CBS domain-containing protein